MNLNPILILLDAVYSLFVVCIIGHFILLQMIKYKFIDENINIVKWANYFLKGLLSPALDGLSNFSKKNLGIDISHLLFILLLKFIIDYLFQHFYVQ